MRYLVRKDRYLNASRKIVFDHDEKKTRKHVQNTWKSSPNEQVFEPDKIHVSEHFLCSSRNRLPVHL